MPRVTWKGEDLGEWSGKPTLKECRLIKSELGIGPREWQDQFEDMDPDAWCAFVAIMLTRAGKPTNLEDVDGEYDDLVVVPDAEEKADAEKAEAEDAGKAPSSESASAESGESETSSSTPESLTSTYS